MDPPSSQLANRVTLSTKVEASGKSACPRVPRACKDLYVSTAVHGVLANTLRHDLADRLARCISALPARSGEKLIVTEAKTYRDSRLRTHDTLYRDLAKVGRTRNSSNTKSDVERHGLRVVRGRLPGPDLGTPPVVTLSYVDSGLGTISAFLTHLAAYQSLFRQLRSFRFLYISPREAEFSRVAERFRHAVKKPLEWDVSEIIRYFHVRSRFESRQYIVPVTEDFEFLNEAKRRFHGEWFENLFQSWDSGALSEPELRRELCQLQPDRTVFFETYLVGSTGHILRR